METQIMTRVVMSWWPGGVLVTHPCSGEVINWFFLERGFFLVSWCPQAGGGRHFSVHILLARELGEVKLPALGFYEGLECFGHRWITNVKAQLAFG